MPDGPRYDDDFYAWTRYQAEVLRTLRTDDNRFDRENVAEEIESLGNSQRDAVRSQVTRILEHLLKLAHPPASDPRPGWMQSIAEARDALNDQRSATLRREVEVSLPDLYRRSRRRATLGLSSYGEPDAAATLRDDWYPARPETPG